MNIEKKQYWWIVGLMILAVLGSGCQGTGVSLADSDQDLTASGTIRATELRIATDMGGRILNIQTKAGAEVKAGDDPVCVFVSDIPLIGFGECCDALSGKSINLRR